MSSSAGYINSGGITGASGGVGMIYSADTPTASTPNPAKSRTQGKHSSLEQDKSPFLPRTDTVNLSPAARQLAQQNSTGSSVLPPTLEQVQSEEQADAMDAKTRTEDTSASKQNAGLDAATPAEEEKAKDEATPTETGAPDLNSQEQQEVQELKLRDQEVRAHEAAHAAVGGQYAGAPTLAYETGPDGKRYAVSGEVNIDLSKVKGNPQETIAKMEQIQAAALAPAQPSAQDRRVAARAAQIATQARMELRTEQSSERSAEPSVVQGSMAPEPTTTSAENTKPQVSQASIISATPSIESLRWTGAVA